MITTETAETAWITSVEIDAALTAPGADVFTYADPAREGNGTWRSVRIEDARGAFQLARVDMPDGRVRYSATQYNGYADDGTAEGRKRAQRFACAWSPTLVVIAPEDDAAVRSPQFEITLVNRRADGKATSRPMYSLTQAKRWQAAILAGDEDREIVTSEIICRKATFGGAE